MQETFEQMIARVNRNGFIPTPKKGERIMAKQVKMGKGKEFNFAAAKSGGQTSKYPWETWFNGDLLLLEQSEGAKDEKGRTIKVTEKKDFEAYVDEMIGKCRSAARRKYKVLQYSKKDADGKKLVGAFIIRARPMTEEEVTAEKARRIEDKKRAKAKAKADSNGHTESTAAHATK